MNFTISGNIVDILQNKIFKGTIYVADGSIKDIQIEANNEEAGLPYLLPGFIDSHVHVESSMLVPSEFAKLAVVHGTVSTISDPHEIANVCGVEGVRYMIENGKTVPFKFNFGAPSCVPATIFETAGAEVTVADIEELLKSDDIKYLTEMMNFPGVLYQDKNVMAKIAAAKRLGKPVDGHAPGLRGDLAKQYIEAGISTDHECFTREEALDKLGYGMKILIREGSAAKNFEALVDLLHDHSANIMFCSDDKHPDSLAEGHINDLCARAVKKGIDVYKVLQAACINPIDHYKLDVGFLRKGDKADFIVVENLDNFKVLKTFIDGQLVAENGNSLIVPKPASVINNFKCSPKKTENFSTKWNGEKEMVVMEALDGQLITNKLSLQPTVENGNIVSNVQTDVLKIVVVNRYNPATIAKAFIKNFGLKQGAIASSVAHDSHNIVAVGVDDESLCRAVNLVIAKEGGVSCVGKDIETILGLPVAGLMSNEDGYAIAEQYAAIDKAAKSLGSTLSAPFMTLSFMALLVIPHAKLSDKGLFDGDSFTFFTP
ncbi:adenine deaminase [Pinibacter soli]|uniref:Adenine deaminase n=1 Tax=Pinibacter soli TaxID=3044211 RepID=A0ABT6RJ29_9BACT|nr:adenine deaminase [Pinibacter soli]MDI3322569.1 adenine deaminase [Pinibacter soli]